MPKYLQSKPAFDAKMNAPPPYSSVDPNTGNKEGDGTFPSRINLFDSQGVNPNILSIIIIVVLTTGNPDSKELTLSTSTIATLSLDYHAVIKPLKRGLKRQDPDRAAEWEKLDILLLRELMQHILHHQDTPNNTYRDWLPTCRVIRPYYRGLGKGRIYGCTIGVAKVVANYPKLERLRVESRGEGAQKDYAEFRALWVQFFGAEWVKKLEESNERKRATSGSKVDDNAGKSGFNGNGYLARLEERRQEMREEARFGDEEDMKGLRVWSRGNGKS